MKPVAPESRLWFLTGIFLLTLVVILSLVPINQPLPIEGADKYEHVLAYFVLMYWWGMVQPTQQWAWMTSLVLLGLSLELIQGLTPYRFMEWRDAAANTAGVILGLLVLHTPASGLMARIDSKLRNRFDSR